MRTKQEIIYRIEHLEECKTNWNERLTEAITNNKPWHQYRAEKELKDIDKRIKYNKRMLKKLGE